MISRDSAAYAIALVLAALASQALAAAPPSLVGNWYGIGEPQDGDIFYIDSFAADGTFHSEFRKCVKGQVTFHQTETGSWQINNSVLWLSVRTVDGKPNPRVDLYNIESFTENEIRARWAPQNYLFVENRVAKFEMRPCFLGS